MKMTPVEAPAPGGPMELSIVDLRTSELLSPPELLSADPDDAKRTSEHDESECESPARSSGAPSPRADELIVPGTIDPDLSRKSRIARIHASRSSRCRVRMNESFPSRAWT
eukprot:Amastigsp_a340389_13.p2 type:complete len:111 gc:universal Amastigsp_a340389_13:560-892(+)